jgi:hypothetical protein
MVLNIRLLGRPRAEADGRELPGPRGRKAWALLAVLLLADSPPSRRSLAGLLFPDAGDPLGALRWTLSQLRRAMRGHAAIGGDPVVVRLGPGCRVEPARTCTGRGWARPLPGEQAVPSPGRVAAQPPRRRAVRWRTARVSSAAWASVSLAPQGERT